MPSSSSTSSTPPTSSTSYRTLNPTTEEVLETFATHDDAAVDAALARAETTFAAWREVPLARRAERLESAAALLESRAADHARLMAVEMGKPLAEGEGESRKCALACRHYAEHGAAYLARQPHPSDASESYVAHEPLGPILAIMPWNFPFWQVFRAAAPALMAGNVVLLKHAPNTPRCALAIEALMREAGVPAGAFQNLFLTNEQAAAVIADRRVRGVTLTGSTAAGRAVGAAAGRALKPCVLELGGSDPFIVCADADLDAAAETAAFARCLNGGQSCIAAKRFLVARDVEAAFTEKFVAAMAARRVGDPLAAGTQIGPMARADLRDKLAAQVAATVGGGARVLLGSAVSGGAAPAGRGFFYPPTVLADIPRGSPAWDDELFGPVAAMIPFASDDEAVTIANATPYGLGAAVWTASRARADAFAARLESGCVFVNGFVKSDPRLPFGGVKDSGFGRELARDGALSFTNAKTVWVK